MSKRTITTTGTGSVSVPRDAAVVTVSASHRAPTLSAALQGAESARAAIVVTASAAVDTDDIATDGLSTWPHHDDHGRPAGGFEARHALRIRCSDLEVAARLLQALADQVGDRLSIDGVAITATPTAEHLASAREAAYADASARAEHLATLAGGELGSVVSVADLAGHGRRPSGLGAEVLAKADVGLSGGAEDLSTSVTVTWRFHPDD